MPTRRSWWLLSRVGGCLGVNPLLIALFLSWSASRSDLDAAAIGPRSFSAKVTESESGRPVFRAGVSVDRFVHPDPKTGLKRVLRTTEHLTDAAGSYRFDLSAEELAEPRLGIVLRVRHPDSPPNLSHFYDLQNALKNEKFGDGLSFDTTLDPGSAISGEVVAPDGTPVAGVVVHSFSFFAPEAKPGFLVLGFGDETRTDAQGRFRFVVRTPGEVELELFPEKYAILVHTIKGNKRGDLGRFVLREGGAITGKVVDPDGQPMPKVTVKAAGIRDKSGENPPSTGPWTSYTHSALTDENGAFDFPPMPPGSYRVVPVEFDRDPILGETFRRLPAPFAPSEVTVKVGEVPKPLRIRALARVAVEARFLDSKGQPLSSPNLQLSGRLNSPDPERLDKLDAYQLVHEDNGFWMGWGWSDASGKIVFNAPRGLKNASIGLMSFTSDEHHAFQYRIGRGTPLRNDDKVDLDDLDRDFRGIEIVSFESPTVLVKVLTEGGTKPEGIRVSASYPDSKIPEEEKGFGSGPSFARQTDGRFRSQRILPDEKITITVQANDFPPRSETLRLPEGVVKELEFLLKK